MKSHKALMFVAAVAAGQCLVSALPVLPRSMMVVQELTVRGLGDAPLVVLGNYQSGDDNQSGNGNVQTSDATTNVSGNANSVTSNSDGATQNQTQNANQTNSSSTANSDQTQSQNTPGTSGTSSSQPSETQNTEQSNSQTVIQDAGGKSASQSSSSNQGNTQSSSQFLQRCTESGM